MARELTTENIEKFYKYFRIGNQSECWRWTGNAHYPDPNRLIGTITFNAKSWTSHVVSFMVHNGLRVRPDGFICHHCDNSICVNPAHLYLGTPQSNVRDRQARNRFRHGKNQRMLTNEQVSNIRELLKTGLTCKQVANKIGNLVSHKTVSNIKNNYIHKV